MNREQTEDLKAFEQRVIDCVSHVRRRSIKWRVLVAVVLLWVVVSMWSWWTDGSEHVSHSPSPPHTVLIVFIHRTTTWTCSTPTRASV
ncbi:hypothetical protein GBAR_LOCUS18550 [Geodia barretti]|uniref:Transmembrane protein 188 n=1 Tax=Geodia barretti TaxID=519541 RepID=A0AA35SPE3_GEOBA|nr:hypothetical protein GBAR_LOCUS18550 [Geodia barretti]